MSDHPQVQQRHLEEIVCDDVWLEIFPYLGTVELALGMALLSDRFDDLVDVHLKKRKWTLGRLQIQRSLNGLRGEIVNRNNGTFERLPIPKQSIPVNLVGFNGISIQFVDKNVIAFLTRIRRLFETSDITLELDIHSNFGTLDFLPFPQQPSLSISDRFVIWCKSFVFTFFQHVRRLLNWNVVAASNSAGILYYNRSWTAVTQKIWPLLAPNISQLRVGNYYSLTQLRTRISPTVLRNCTNLRSIETAKYLLPLGLPDDNAAAYNWQAIAKWLLYRRAGDGRPKVLKQLWEQPVDYELESFIQNFLVAFTPVSYIFVFLSRAGDEPFVLENGLTRERLQLRRVNPFLCLMSRSPIARDETQWEEWEHEALAGNKNNLINICLSDNDIGFRRPRPSPASSCGIM